MGEFRCRKQPQKVFLKLKAITKLPKFPCLNLRKKNNKHVNNRKRTNRECVIPIIFHEVKLTAKEVEDNTQKYNKVVIDTLFQQIITLISTLWL